MSSYGAHRRCARFGDVKGDLNRLRREVRSQKWVVLRYVVLEWSVAGLSGDISSHQGNVRGNLH